MESCVQPRPEVCLGVFNAQVEREWKGGLKPLAWVRAAVDARIRRFANTLSPVCKCYTSPYILDLPIMFIIFICTNYLTSNLQVF